MKNKIKEFKSNAIETMKAFKGSTDYQIVKRSIEITYNTLYGHVGLALWAQNAGQALTKEIEENF